VATYFHDKSVLILASRASFWAICQQAHLVTLGPIQIGFLGASIGVH
jgi:hypothetical protein